MSFSVYPWFISGISLAYTKSIPNRLCLSQAYTKLILFVSEKRTQIGNPQPTWARSNTLLIGHTNIYLFLESAGAGAGFWAPSAPLVRWRRQPPALPRSRLTAHCATPRRKGDVCFRRPSWDLQWRYVRGIPETFIPRRPIIHRPWTGLQPRRGTDAPWPPSSSKKLNYCVSIWKWNRGYTYTKKMENV